MLTSLSQLVDKADTAQSNGFHWAIIEAELVAKALPFWDNRDIQRIVVNLHEKGVILLGSAPFGESQHFKFAFNEHVEQHTRAKAAAPIQPKSSIQQEKPRNIFSRAIHQPIFSKQHMAPNWQPDAETLQQLNVHGVPEHFAREQVPRFVTYWRDRGETHASWESKFMQHATHQWRSHQLKSKEKNATKPIVADWQPSTEALEILVQRSEIPRNFIEDAVPEFVLYWQERGESSNTWNSRFIQHVNLQWKKYSSAVESQHEPRAMTKQWQPSQDVYEVLRLANIPVPFAQQLVPEFVLYWMDTRQIHTSWSTKFLQHVKRCWAHQHNKTPATTTNAADTRSTRDISLNEELSDRSWAS